MINEQELVEIEKRCKHSTQGPWKAYIEGRDHTSGSHVIITGVKSGDYGEAFEIDGARADDYDFIANAKQDIPRLIEEIRRLKKPHNQ